MSLPAKQQKDNQPSDPLETIIKDTIVDLWFEAPLRVKIAAIIVVLACAVLFEEHIRTGIW